jgi:hypothetical protein
MGARAERDALLAELYLLWEHGGAPMTTLGDGRKVRRMDREGELVRALRSACWRAGQEEAPAPNLRQAMRRQDKETQDARPTDPEARPE